MGETYSGFKASTRFLGITVSVSLEPASGAMVLTMMLYLAPSWTSVLARPTMPILAAE